MEAFIQVMESTIAVRDPYTVAHQRQVTRIVCAIGQELGLGRDRLNELRIAASLHDLGKIAIPTGLLAKSGRLNSVEFTLLKTHPQVAYDILKPIKLPGNAAEIILQHHERLDGSGYPRGLRGPEILLEARVLAVADVLEAMCSHRPYRASLGLTLTLEELTRNRGILYDAAVVEVGLSLYGHLSKTGAETPGMSLTEVEPLVDAALPAQGDPATPYGLPDEGHPWLGNMGGLTFPANRQELADTFNKGMRHALMI